MYKRQGYARVSGRVGVCLVTSGPGATNTVTGLADALMDSTPLVLVTGQVGSSLLGTDAFQETNFVGITQAVTKWNCQVKRTEEKMCIRDSRKPARTRFGGDLDPVAHAVERQAHDVEAAAQIRHQMCIRDSNYTVSIPPGGRTDAFVQTIITWEMGGKVFKTRGLDADQTEAAIKATIKMLNIIETNYNDHEC